jgi:hypothetical protein
MDKVVKIFLKQKLFKYYQEAQHKLTLFLMVKGIINQDIHNLILSLK